MGQPDDASEEYRPQDHDHGNLSGSDADRHRSVASVPARSESRTRNPDPPRPGKGNGGKICNSGSSAGHSAFHPDRKLRKRAGLHHGGGADQKQPQPAVFRRGDQRVRHVPRDARHGLLHRRGVHCRPHDGNSDRTAQKDETKSGPPRAFVRHLREIKEMAPRKTEHQRSGETPDSTGQRHHEPEIHVRSGVSARLSGADRRAASSSPVSASAGSKRHVCRDPRTEPVHCASSLRVFRSCRQAAGTGGGGPGRAGNQTDSVPCQRQLPCGKGAGQGGAERQTGFGSGRAQGAFR